MSLFDSDIEKKLDNINRNLNELNSKMDILIKLLDNLNKEIRRDR